MPYGLIRRRRRAHRAVRTMAAGGCIIAARPGVRATVTEITPGRYLVEERSPEVGVVPIVAAAPTLVALVARALRRARGDERRALRILADEADEADAKAEAVDGIGACCPSCGGGP